MSEEMKHNHDCHDEGCDCECGCGDELDVVYLEKEDGTEVGLPIVDSFIYKDVEYIVVDDEDEESSYIFSVVEQDGEEALEPLADEMFDEVSDYYESLLQEDEEEAGKDE